MSVLQALLSERIAAPWAIVGEVAHGLLSQGVVAAEMFTEDGRIVRAAGATAYLRGRSMRRHHEFRGPHGHCICLGCGARKPHTPGVRCLDERCPKCGKAMVREGSSHHHAYLEKQGRSGVTG